MFVIVVVVLAVVLMAFITMWLVNYLFAPSFLLTVFGLSQITLWKAFCLNFLCGILFKNISINTSKKK